MVILVAFPVVSIPAKYQKEKNRTKWLIVNKNIRGRDMYGIDRLKTCGVKFHQEYIKILFLQRFSQQDPNGSEFMLLLFGKFTIAK